MFSRVHHKRIMILTMIAVVGGCVAALILFALKNNINLFFTPSELKQSPPNPQALIRVGGMVANNSLRYLTKQDKSQIHIEFMLHDTKDKVLVEYHGVLPDLFREGQGVVVQGRWQPPRFQAVQVLAKHDENYMPPQIMQAMKETNDT